MVALSIGFALVQLRTSPHAIWILVSLTVVMVPNPEISKQVEKALSRIIGTALGVIFGILTLTLHLDQFWLLLSLLLYSLCISYLKMRKFISDYAATLGLVSYIIVTLTPNSGWQIGLERGLEIILGVLVALVVSTTIFPLRSQTIMRELFTSNWHIIRLYYRLRIIEEGDVYDLELMELEKKFLKQQSELSHSLTTLKSKRKKTSSNDLKLRRIQLALMQYINIIGHLLTHHAEYLCSSKDLWNQIIISLDLIFEKIDTNKIETTDLESFNQLLKEFSKSRTDKGTSEQKEAFQLLTLILRRIAYLIDNWL